jgi:hypothetical protein
MPGSAKDDDFPGFGRIRRPAFEAGLCFSVLGLAVSAIVRAGLLAPGKRGAIIFRLQPARLRSSRRGDVWDFTVGGSFRASGVPVLPASGFTTLLNQDLAVAGGVARCSWWRWRR